MTKVKCEWMMCMYNDSSTYGEHGYCTKEEIQLDFDEDDKENEYLVCKDYHYVTSGKGR